MDRRRLDGRRPRTRSPPLTRHKSVFVSFGFCPSSSLTLQDPFRAAPYEPVNCRFSLQRQWAGEMLLVVLFGKIDGTPSASRPVPEEVSQCFITRSYFLSWVWWPVC